MYEAILGRTIDKRNFRRRVVGLSFIRETGQYQKQTAHRPARLYSFTSPRAHQLLIRILFC